MNTFYNYAKIDKEFRHVDVPISFTFRTCGAVQFLRAFTKVPALGWNHCCVAMVSDCNNPGRSSVERQNSPVIGATLPFGEKEVQD